MLFNCLDLRSFNYMFFGEVEPSQHCTWLILILSFFFIMLSGLQAIKKILFFHRRGRVRGERGREERNFFYHHRRVLEQRLHKLGMLHDWTVLPSTHMITELEAK